jgi:hypothetical protein
VYLIEEKRLQRDKKGKEEPSLSDDVKMRRRDEGDRRFNAGPI